MCTSGERVEGGKYGYTSDSGTAANKSRTTLMWST